MMTHQLADTLVDDHRSSLLRDASVRRLRRRTVRAVVRTAAVDPGSRNWHRTTCGASALDYATLQAANSSRFTIMERASA